MTVEDEICWALWQVYEETRNRKNRDKKEGAAGGERTKQLSQSPMKTEIIITLGI